MPDAALMRFLKPFQLGLQKVEPFHVGNDRGLSGFMSAFEIGRFSALTVLTGTGADACECADEADAAQINNAAQIETRIFGLPSAQDCNPTGPANT